MKLRAIPYELHYASVEQTRAFAVELPAGNPFGFGARQMPVIAIAAAVGTFAAGAGIATAVGATMGAMIVGGAMMIGAALTIVGIATDRPNLVKWGGYLSLAGGIGALGLGAMGMLTSEVAGSVASDAAAGSLIDVAPGAVADTVISEVPGQVTQLSGPIGDAGGAAGMLATGNAPVAAPGLETVGEPAFDVAQPGVQADVPAPLSSQATVDLAPKAPNAFDTQTTSAFDPNALANEAAGFVPGTTGAPEGYFDKFGKWVKANPELARAGFQAVGGLLQSAVPKPQTEYERALTEEARRRSARNDPNSSWWRQSPRGG